MDSNLAKLSLSLLGLEWSSLKSYAGFLTISEEFGSHLYFWFFPSQSDPSKDPVILWLQVRELMSMGMSNRRPGLGGATALSTNLC